jgi:hypothetical protein
MGTTVYTVCTSTVKHIQIFYKSSYMTVDSAAAASQNSVHLCITQQMWRGHHYGET